MKHVVRFVAALCLALALSSPATAQDYTKWYLAEGSTGFFDEEILIANPNADPAIVSIRYFVPAGFTAPAVRSLTIGGSSRATVRVKDDIDIHAVSALVTSNVPIIVERSMYWGGPARLGGHNATGVNAPQMEWFLAEGVSNAIFDEFILIANPNDGPVEVQIDYLGTDGIRDVDTYVVAANSRRTIHAAVDLEAKFKGKFRNHTFSARVKSLTEGRPIIAERAIYWGGIFAAGLNPGGTAEAGISTLSDTWRFGEGFTAGGFQTFVLVANPNPTDVTIDTTFYLEDGTTATDTRTLPPNSRTNIWVNAEVGRASNHPFSIMVKARGQAQVAAERAMYWGGLREGHVVAGIPLEARKWGFAEGLEDRFGGVEYDTYYLLSNAGESPVTVKATFMLEDGTGFVDNFQVNARSRYTLIAARYKELSNRRFAAVFEASASIVAERAVYWGPNYYGGHASAGIVLPDAFVVGTPMPVTGPTVTSISPAFGSTNGGTDVTIKGTNFGMDATVTIGGVNANRQVIDAQTIIARSPGGTVGAKPVVVTSVGKSATSPADFTYESPAPPPPPPPPPGTANGPAQWVYPRSFPYFFDVVQQVANERRDLLFSSCTEHDGVRVPGGNNEFMFEVVRRLRTRTGSNRWGLNWKRGNAGDLSQDIVTYYYGPEGVTMEGRTDVFIIDIIGGHCGSNPSPNWQDQTRATADAGTIGRWTTAGRSF